MVAHAPGGSGGVRPALLALVVLMGAGCGHRGTPLPPFVHIPAAVKSITAERSGDDVYLTLTVPATNIDGSHPADVSRIEVFGYTGRQAPPRAQFLDVATSIATIPVAPPVTTEGAPTQSAPAAASSRRRGTTPAVAGIPVTVVERLTPKTLMQGPPVIAPPERRGRKSVAPRATLTSSSRRVVAEMPLRRFYMAIPFNPGGRQGPPSPISEFPLSDVPAPPANLVAGYTESVLTLSWDPSGGLVGFLLDRPRSVEPAPTDDDEPAPVRAASEAAPPAPGPTRYNVYREEPAGTTPVPSGPGAAARPVPINPAPLETPVFTGPVEFGQERCYVVRAIRAIGSATTESDASRPLCLVAEDHFPPAPPSRLTAVPARGIISLLWEASGASDLAGYVVLRGVPGDATLRRITPMPLTDTRFTDTTVLPGRRYVYAVAAVDRAGNISEPSNRVEEARAEQ